MPRESGMNSHFGEYRKGEIPDPLRAVRQKANDISKQLQKSKEKQNLDTSNTNEIMNQNVKMINNFLDYQTTINIYALDEYNNKTAQFTYYNSFITSLGEIRYNYRDATELESVFQFEFSQMDIKLLEEGIPLGI
jgi:hypothetical protein